ncbi:tRNA 2-selenouridine synthase [Bdellovibrio bacteriovorus W]|nr:tRNA 2-selenouridine synthase [Bdellovibrio bacteriovorus W]
MERISPQQLADLFLKHTPLIDVRAPVEFAVGSLPNAVNLPLMKDDERAAVGTTYKNDGKEKAIALGHELVSGSVRDERIERWKKFVQANPETVLYCFRGGLRSQISQRWLKENGIHRPIIDGGYKEARSFLRETLETKVQGFQFLVLSGPTGSAKTHLLERLSESNPVIDLEKAAHHRGSAFGAMGSSQSTQINFENDLAVQALKILNQGHLNQRVLIEDESRMIGQCAVPEELFLAMRMAPVLYVDEPLESRVENIFIDYILNSAIGQGDPELGKLRFQEFTKSIEKIAKKLGGLRSQELLNDLEHSREEFNLYQALDINRVWIRKLLLYYYDPLYAKSLMRRNPRVIFKGSYNEVSQYVLANQ